MNMQPFSKTVLAFIAAATIGTPAAADNHMSQVDLSAHETCDCAKGDANGKTAIIAKLNVPFKAAVRYKVGWSKFPSQGGSEISHRSDISDPDYQLFGSALPPGLRFNSDNGLLEGSPTTPGQWEIWPAMRDKAKGESPYRGQGYWWTTYRQYEGKTWIESKAPTVIVVLPAATGKEFRLQCTAQGHTGESLIVEVDYENKLVKFVGSSGKIAAVYNVTVDSDVVGWNKMNGPLYANSALLDRKTGQLRYRHQVENREFAYSCEKRSEQQKF